MPRLVTTSQAGQAVDMTLNFSLQTVASHQISIMHREVCQHGLIFIGPTEDGISLGWPPSARSVNGQIRLQRSLKSITGLSLRQKVGISWASYLGI